MSMRISGFAEGFDTESMVSALMEVERTPLHRIQNDIYGMENELSAWNKVETSVGKLESAVQDLTSYTSWQQMSATAQDESVLTLSAATAAAEGKYDITVSQMAQSQRIASDAQADITSALGLSGDFTVGGQSISVATDDSLESIRDAINSASVNMDDDQRVQAVIVDTSLVLEREATGATDITLSEGTGDILETLGVLDASKAVKNELDAGKDLAANVSGIDITRSSNTNLTDVIAGVTLNVQSEGSTTFSIERDRETIKSLIDEFISAYNSTMQTVEGQGEANIDGTDVEAATLQGDSLIRAMQARSRTLVTSTDDAGKLEESFNTLRKIGIGTSGEDNRISLTDSEALDSALQTNFDEVEDLFRDYDAGILRGLDDYLGTLTSAVDGGISRRQSGVEGRIDNQEDRMVDLERRLTSYEDQLRDQFGAMDSMIASLQQQTSFLSSLTSSSTNN